METGAAVRKPEKVAMSSIECLAIGSGLAGAMTAMRLTQGGREVLLLAVPVLSSHL
jgi:succinate dehydrogenase/fumarate reductase flavoprotein subunit